MTSLFPFLTGYVPTKCGRAVLDNVVSEKESDQLLALAKKGFAKGGGSGGASILDLHSGAISKVITQIIIDATYTKCDFTIFYRSVTSYSFETMCFLQGDAFVSIYRSHPDLYTTEDFVTYR